MDTDIANIELIAKQVVSLLRTRIPITKAYLFGSHIEGKTHEDNDIDIAIFSPVADNMNFEEKVKLIVKAESRSTSRLNFICLAQQASRKRVSPIFSVISARTASRLTNLLLILLVARSAVFSILPRFN